jgi:hypothetical protein
MRSGRARGGGGSGGAGVGDGVAVAGWQWHRWKAGLSAVILRLVSLRLEQY